MALFWNNVRAAARQRRDGSRHSITVSEQKFVYRKDDSIREIPLTDIMDLKDHVEDRARMVEIVYQKPDESHGTLPIIAIDFSNAWVRMGKIGALLWEAIQANRNQ